MKNLALSISLLAAAGSLILSQTVAPVPPSNLGYELLPGEPTAADLARSREIIHQWESSQPAKGKRTMHIVYWTPADREPLPEFRPRLSRVMHDIQAFYRKELAKWGFPNRSIQLDEAADGLVNITVVKGKLASADCSESDSKDGQEIKADCAAALKAKGVEAKNETMVIFCNLADWDPVKRKMSHHSPYYASGTSTQGTAWQLDSPLLDSAHLAVKDQHLDDAQYGHISLGKYNSIFVGGVCHELGHALGLPHCRECAAAAKTRGTALMGSGNRTFGDDLRGDGKGSFLSLPHALKLAVHPQFSGSVKQMNEPLKADYSELKLAPGEHGLTISGAVKGNLPIHAVLAYGDPDGGADYDSQITAGIPSADGKFSLTLPFPDKKNVGARLHLVSVAANGAATSGVWSEAGYTLPAMVDAAGHWDIRGANLKLAMESDWTKLPADALAKLSPNLPEAFRRMKLPNSTEGKPSPKSVAETQKVLPLSDASPSKSSVGYAKLGVDRNMEGQPLLTSEGVARHGLFAHANSEIMYDLGGKWQNITGSAGFPAGADAKATAAIYADGKQIWKSKSLGGKPQAFDLPVSGCQELKLEFLGIGGNRGAWTTWFEPELKR